MEVVIEKMVIGGYRYQVLSVNGLESEEGPLFGRVVWDDCSIMIEEEISAQMAGPALIHESLHVINRYNGLELEEREIEVLAMQFARLIKDNPEMVDIIQKTMI